MVESDDQRQQLYRISGAGVEFASSMIGFGVVGYLLDWWLGTLPWLMLVGIVLGFVGGMVRLVRLLKSSSKRR